MIDRRPSIWFCGENLEKPLILSGSKHHLPILVVAEYASETIERTTIPPLIGRQRQLLIARRLKQAFPETDYYLATSDSTDQHLLTPQTHFLFWAITAPDPLESLLRQQTEQQTIRGIWTLTQVVRTLLSSLRFRSATAHLIVIASPCGTRFIVWRQRDLIFTRLIPYPLSPTDVSRELDRTAQYLYNQGLIPRGTRLPTWFWGIDPTDSTTGYWYEEKSPPSLTRHLPQLPNEPIAALLSWWQRRFIFPPSLAPARWLHSWYWQQLRLALIAGGLLLNGTLIAMAAVNGWYATTTFHQTMRLAQVKQQIESRTQTTLAAVGALGVSAETLLSTIDAHRAIFSHLLSLSESLDVISRAFARVPHFRLESLTWHRALPSSASVPQRPGNPAPAASSPLEISCPPKEENDLTPRIWIMLVGTVPSHLALREINAQWNDFITTLSSERSLQIVASRPPIDTSPRATIIGDHQRVEVSSFALCLVLQKGIS